MVIAYCTKQHKEKYQRGNSQRYRTDIHYIINVVF